jgi:hypothetical protein
LTVYTEKKLAQDHKIGLESVFIWIMQCKHKVRGRNVPNINKKASA